MSEQELNIGVVKLVSDVNLSLKDNCKNLCDKLNIKTDDPVGYIRYDLTCYIISNNKIYQIVENKRLRNPDVEYLHDIGGGKFFYIMGFYNGATCLQEILTDNIKEYENSSDF